VNRLGSKIKAHERHLAALELRKAGASYQTIAERLGYRSSSGAHKAVSSALKATLREPADELRELEVTRLDAALLAIWRRVQSGDERAIDRLLGIMKRRAALLGLDRPARRELSGPGGGPLTAQVEIPDLSALSDQELTLLEEIHAKLAAGSAGRRG
jgi:hypothetical protein